MQTKRNELVAQPWLPQAVLDVALVDSEAIKLGVGSSKAYTVALRMGKTGAGEDCG